MPRTRTPFALLILAAGLLSAGACGEPGDAAEENGEVATASGDRSPYVGIDVCAECHEERATGFREGAHFRTSSIATRSTVLGTIEPGGSKLLTSNPDLHFLLTEREDGLYQAAITGGRTEVERRIDIVLGSGKLGQSYAYWWNGRLLQLPVSYLAADDSWINSPGAMFQDGTAEWLRPIVPRCMECHSTWIDHVEGSSHGFVRGTLEPGVTCERCHGPGAEHVAYHRENPDDREGAAIANPGAMERQQSLDVCGQCHGGLRRLKRPAYSYRPGEDLDEHLLPAPPPDPKASGVHSSNQLPRLLESRCFQQSDFMTCATCHDPHQHERGKLKTFSRRCLTCHQVADCGECADHPDPESDCITCHMPVTEDDSTKIHQPDSLRKPLVRDHKIRVLNDD